MLLPGMCNKITDYPISRKLVKSEALIKCVIFYHSQ